MTALAEVLRGRPRGEILAALSRFSDAEVAALVYDWLGLWARAEQRPPPGTWLVWLILSGRGWGKTRTGAEFVRAEKERTGRIALVAPTAADARDVMVEGESGLLAIAPPWDRPSYEPTKRRVTWRNGAMATCYSADEPDRLRGPQHGAAWCDELAAWRYVDDAWDNLMLGLRLGTQPRCVVTTTPRPLTLLRKLVSDPNTHVTTGSTHANLSNLAPHFARTILDRYEGTSRAEQEIHGRLLDEMPGALWTRTRIEALRVAKVPELRRIVVGVDPAVSAGEDAAETGVVTCGLGADGHLYVLADDSLRGSPDSWARAVVTAYRHWRADRVMAEANQGGAMVESVLRTIDPNLPIKLVHASRGKAARAEPVAALAEQGRWHVVGGLPRLEDQLVGWLSGEDSPDRLDAMTWACSELLATASSRRPLVPWNLSGAGWRPNPWDLGDSRY